MERRTRGMRNNNPLNIRRVVGTHWKGEVVSPIEDKEFVQFCDIEHGVRAAFKILETYRKKYQAVCVRDIISRWAPPSENDTKGYINGVLSLMPVEEDTVLTEKHWPALVWAMAIIESNMYLYADTLERAWKLYKTLK